MSQMEIDEYGTKIWRDLNGHFHRENGPAIEYVDGAKLWYINGQLHRVDGAAVEYTNGPAVEFDGLKEWYINGRLHRVDGPALEYADGAKFWFINGRQYSFEDWLNKLQISDEEKVMLCLKWK